MNEQIRVEKKASAYPIYVSGVAWVIGCVFLNMISLIDYLICFGLAILAYLISNKLFKPIEIITKIPQSSGDLEVDKMLVQKDQFVKHLQDLDIAIENASVSQSIVDINKLTNSIFAEVMENPQLASRLRKFMNYYLPTLIKLCTSYAELEKQAFNGEIYDETAEKIDKALILAKEAFKNQLDQLYTDKAMDITADISVLESLMKQEGLVDNQMQDKI